MTRESSDPSQVTAPPEEAAPAFEEIDKVIMITFAPEAVLLPGTELQPELARWRQGNHHKRLLVSGGVWPMDEVSLHIQRVGAS